MSTRAEQARTREQAGVMTHTPHYDELGDIALLTDSQITERVGALLEKALRRQVWIMFLDDASRQLPVLMPSYVPRRPNPADACRLADFFRELGDELEAATIVVTFERPGQGTLNDRDRAWLAMLREGCLLAGMSFRGPLLCHSDGVRWVPLDEYLSA